MQIEKIIKAFQGLDLSTYPETEIRELFNKVGPVGAATVNFHKGKSIMRARPNWDMPRFRMKCDFSFKPQKFNETYQRASTPHKTMFYATSVPDDLGEDELDNMRIIGITETLPILRDKTKSGIEKISFGRWVVKEDISLMAVVHEKDFYSKSKYTRELVDVYEDFINQYPKDLVNKSLKFQNFLSGEFSKPDINRDYEYMISAIFADNVIKTGFDGVLYPSVRTGGQGFNVAITPETTSKLELCVAGECTMYKHLDQVVVGNDAIANLKGTEEEFDMVDLENHEHLYLAKLGVNSIDDLLKS